MNIGNNQFIGGKRARHDRGAGGFDELAARERLRIGRDGIILHNTLSPTEGKD